jgi:hypothetical protein
VHLVEAAGVEPACRLGCRNASTNTCRVLVTGPAGPDPTGSGGQCVI